jgi:hypothetical protein
MRGGRAAAFYGSVAFTSLASLLFLNLAADRLPVPGLRTLRDYMIRRNG